MVLKKVEGYIKAKDGMFGVNITLAFGERNSLRVDDYGTDVNITWSVPRQTVVMTGVTQYGEALNVEEWRIVKNILKTEVLPALLDDGLVDADDVHLLDAGI